MIRKLHKTAALGSFKMERNMSFMQVQSSSQLDQMNRSPNSISGNFFQKPSDADSLFGEKPEAASETS